jgi:hypothetical protein
VNRACLMKQLSLTTHAQYQCAGISTLGHVALLVNHTGFADSAAGWHSEQGILNMTADTHHSSILRPCRNSPPRARSQAASESVKPAEAQKTTTW